MDQFGLRIKLYVVNCKKHPVDSEEDYFASNPEYDGQIQTIAHAYRYLSYNSHVGDIDVIADDLRQTKCIGYSCVAVLLNTDCICRTKMFRRILKAIKQNDHLLYKSKLLMTTYTKKLQFRQVWERDMSEIFLKKYFKRLRQYSLMYSSNCLIHPNLEKLYSNGYAKDKRNPFNKIRKYIRVRLPWEKEEEYKPYNDDHIKNFTQNDRNPMKDHYYFHQSKLNHAIFMQCFINNSRERGIEIDTLMFQAYGSPMKPLEDILKENCYCLGNFRIIQSTVRDKFIFYGINPTLAIVINNYYFPVDDEEGNRLGSEEDVKRLSRELKIAGIPYVIIQDCGRDKLLKLMKFLENLDCSALQSFLFFIMSHGGSNDIIRSHDGDVSVKEDIVKSIKSNATLQNVETVIVVTACRGGLDPDHMDFDDLDDIEHTDSSHLLDNIVILYSSPDEVISCRCEEHGSRFIMSLCKQFRKCRDLKQATEHINEDLKQASWYKGFEEVPELVTSDTQKPRNIPKSLTDPLKMIKFIETLLNALKTLDEYNRTEKDVDDWRPLFCVSGSLGAPYGYARSFADQYLDRTLDNDQWTEDNLSILEKCRIECVSTKKMVK